MIDCGKRSAVCIGVGYLVTENPSARCDRAIMQFTRSPLPPLELSRSGSKGLPNSWGSQPASASSPSETFFISIGESIQLWVVCQESGFRCAKRHDNLFGLDGKQEGRRSKFSPRNRFVHDRLRKVILDFNLAPLRSQSYCVICGPRDSLVPIP
jgi:hypothetical protein